MKCPKCGAEMKTGYLFGSKDGAISFANEVPGAFENANEVPGAFENAKGVDGFVEIKPLKVGGRTSTEANCCLGCRMVAFRY